MFEYKEGRLISQGAGQTYSYERFAMLFDGSDSILLCMGDVSTVTAKYDVMCKCKPLEELSKPVLVVVDNITEKFCDEINRMIDCTGYAKIWLRDNGYATSTMK